VQEELEALRKQINSGKFSEPKGPMSVGNLWKGKVGDLWKGKVVRFCSKLKKV